MAKKSGTKSEKTVPAVSGKPGNITQNWLLFAITFILYANTLGHGFVLDDGLVILENAYTKAGLSGIVDILTHDTFHGYFQKEGMDTLVSGGRYRPVSQVLFALICQFFGENAFVFHLVNVLLYSLTVVVLFHTLRLLLRDTREEIARNVPWMAALLFAVHPIHTEVVANIKSADEILALLGSLATLYYTLRSFDTGEKKWLLLAGVTFLLACLSKENAVAYIVLIPVAIRYFRSEKKSLMGHTWPVIAAFLAFFIIRGSILPWSSLAGTAPAELLNNPFLKDLNGQLVPFSFTEKLATILFTLWKYLQLLIVPQPLTHDYYPRQVDVTSLTDPFVLLAVVLYGFIVYRTVRGIMRRDPESYGWLAFLLPLGVVSNLLFPIGTNMSERFVFMPSVGICLVAALLLERWQQRGGAARMLWISVLILFSLKTFTRNFAWESNEKLYRADIAVSDRSIKLQIAYAQVLLERARETEDAAGKTAFVQEGLKHINSALALYPDFPTALVIRGNLYAEAKKYPEAIADHRKVFAGAPDNVVNGERLATTLRGAGLDAGQLKRDFASSRVYLNEAWQINPRDPETARLLGVLNMVQGDRDAALEWFQKGEAVAGEDAAALWELGVAYNNLGMPDKARVLQQKAYQVDPDIVKRVQDPQ
jgi:Flp pilus assembly protein TadD